jgi:hypothetical protein
MGTDANTNRELQRKFMKVGNSASIFVEPRQSLVIIKGDLLTK